VSVCAVVCVSLDVCVPHADKSSELWRFSTLTHGWVRVDTPSTNDARPSARSGHTMTSIGLDLWVHGGSPYIPMTYDDRGNVLAGGHSGDGDT
jgi:hypothetical protein